MGLHHYDDLDDATEVIATDEELIADASQDVVTDARSKREAKDARGAIERLLEERRLRRMITDIFDDPLDA